MARKKIATYSNDGKTVHVYRDAEWNEFVVRIPGAPDADYFTPDKDDAISTAQTIVGLK